MDEPQSSYKWCIVPKCKNTSIKNPAKVFINVPKNEKMRKKWLQAVRRDPKDISVKSICFVCEDHFNLQNDMENYVKWKLVGGRKLLKKDVIPHRFDCQADRKRSFTSIPRQTAVKRGRFETIQEAEKDCHYLEEEALSRQVEKHLEEPTPSTSLDISNKREIGVQTNIKPHYRSKLIQCELSKVSVLDSASSPFISKYQSDVATSPFKSIGLQKAPRRKLGFNDLGSSTSTDTESSSSDSVYKVSSSLENSSKSNEPEYESDFKAKEMSKIALQHTHYIISRNIRRYLGMPKECAFLVDLLQKYASLNITNIYLTLKKIRLSQTFAELGDDFGMSESAASRTSVLVISKVMQDLIIWPSSDLVKRNLPIAFRARYSKVQTIIDCLEIEIQKPSDAVKQALTWSEYKKANTLKYLISSTPDGIINFVSVGYGGRTSDALIVEKCGFLDKLHPGVNIMADRGFKHIDALLTNWF